MCVYNQYFSPGACRPDWIMAAAGFSQSYIACPNPVPVQQSPAKSYAVSCRQNGAPLSPAPHAPRTRRKKGGAHREKDKGKSAFSRGPAPLLALLEEHLYSRSPRVFSPAGFAGALSQRLALGENTWRKDGGGTASRPGHTTSTCPTGFCLTYCRDRSPWLCAPREAGSSGWPGPFAHS